MGEGGGRFPRPDQVRAFGVHPETASSAKKRGSRFLWLRPKEPDPAGVLCPPPPEIISQVKGEGVGVYLINCRSR